jgi:hypothetical protein
MPKLTEELNRDFQVEVGAAIDLRESKAKAFAVATPFMFTDGDIISVYFAKKDGFPVFTDFGNSYMHFDILYSGQDLEHLRQQLFPRILQSHDIRDDDGELWVPIDNDIGSTLLRFCQAIVQAEAIALAWASKEGDAFLMGLELRLGEQQRTRTADKATRA